MQIFIAGGLGFIGGNLVNFFLHKGYQVTAVGTRSNPHAVDHHNFTYIAADMTIKGDWQEELEDIDVAINLAGRTIFKPWTKRYKNQIHDSRILSTRNLVDSIQKNKKVVLCNASAVGYYGNRGDEILEETASQGNDFLAKVTGDWEDEALKGEEKGIRVVMTRFGIVLGKDGGAMKKMVPAFRYFAGGPMGNGRQWFPWIHMDDLLSAVMLVMENTNIKGPVNFCSHQPVRNRDLAKTLGRILNRPSFMPAPGFMIRLILGELGSSLLCSQHCVPRVLLKHGFIFKYPDIRDAIQNFAQH